MSRQVRRIFVLLRMRFWRLAGEPEVYTEISEAAEAFEEYTRMSWEDAQTLAEELGGDPDEIVGGPFAGTTILTVEIPEHSCCAEAR
jgi:hypothetical protein